MNPGGQGGRVAISSADQDAAMTAHLPVKIDEIATVECQHGPIQADGECQDVGVLDPLVPLASLLDREDVEAKLSQLDDDRIFEILVGIQPGHPSRILIRADGLIDLLAVAVVIIPGGFQVDPGQVGMTIEDLGIGQAQPPPLHQAGDSVASLADAGVAASNAAAFLDPTGHLDIGHGCPPAKVSGQS